MPSTMTIFPHPLQTSLGYQLNVFFRLWTQCLFRWHLTTDSTGSRKGRVASLALSRPLINETIIVASDIDVCGLRLIAIRNTPTSADSVDALRLTIGSVIR